MDCIFCKIINNEIEACKIYESEHFIGFLDRNPLVFGHSLIVPKRHAGTVFELNEEEQKELGTAIYKILKILEKKFGSSIVLYNTSGESTSHSISHFHIHLIPRTKDDRFWDGSKSKIVLDGSSGFGRLDVTDEQLKILTQELNR